MTKNLGKSNIIWCKIWIAICQAKIELLLKFQSQISFTDIEQMRCVQISDKGQGQIRALGARLNMSLRFY